MGRKTIIGVMGGDHTVGAVATDAQRIGASITKAATILLTGGSVVEGTKVKDAAMRGAQREGLAPDQVARLIGILPDGPRCWEESDHSLFLRTNLDHKERDAINGVTPDVLIFFPGSSGTLCELAFALNAQKPVLYWRAVEMLKTKFRTHVKDGELSFYLASALKACTEKLGPKTGFSKETTVLSLFSILSSTLEGAADFSGNIEDLVPHALRLAGSPTRSTGFPGFRDEVHSKGRFEEIVERISA